MTAPMPDMPSVEMQQTGGWPTPDGSTQVGGDLHAEPHTPTCQQIAAGEPFPGSPRPSD